MLLVRMVYNVIWILNLTKREFKCYLLGLTSFSSKELVVSRKHNILNIEYLFYSVSSKPKLEKID